MTALQTGLQQAPSFFTINSTQTNGWFIIFVNFVMFLVLALERNRADDAV